jgi:hypothetical protein
MRPEMRAYVTPRDVPKEARNEPSPINNQELTQRENNIKRKERYSSRIKAYIERKFSF